MIREELNKENINETNQSPSNNTHRINRIKHCTFFPKGTCRNGDKCTFKHELPGLVSLTKHCSKSNTTIDSIDSKNENVFDEQLRMKLCFEQNKKHNSALTTCEIYEKYYNIDSERLYKYLNATIDLKTASDDLKVIYEAHFLKITKLFPGSQGKSKGQCVESELNSEGQCVDTVLTKSPKIEDKSKGQCVETVLTKSPNNLTPDGRKIDLILSATHDDNMSLGNRLPRLSVNEWYNSSTGVKWHRLNKKKFYSVDFDFSLWKTSSCHWELDSYRPVALALLSILVAGIETGLDLLSGNRDDKKPSAEGGLRHLRREARLFSQLVYEDKTFTLNREFAEEIGFDHKVLAKRLSMLIKQAIDQSDKEYQESGNAEFKDIKNEIQFIREQLFHQYAPFRDIILNDLEV